MILLHHVSHIGCRTARVAPAASTRRRTASFGAALRRAALVGCVCSGMATAGAQTVLTPDSCVRLALEHNRTLASARLQTERYEHTQKAYRANFLPNFKLTASDLWSTSDGGLTVPGGYLPTFVPAADGTMVPNLLVNPATGQPVLGPDGVTPVFQTYAYHPDVSIDYKIGNILQAGIAVEQPIYMGGKVAAAYRMAHLGAEMSRLNERISEQEIIVGVYEACALLVHASEMRHVAAAADSLLGRLLNDVEAARRHGMASRNDVLKVRVKKSETELGVQKADNGRRLAQMNLCHRIGLPLTSDVSVEAAPEAQSADAVRLPDVEATVESRPEYTILDYKTRIAIEQMKLERSEFLPQVALVAGYSYMHGLEVNDRILFDRASFSALLNVSVPLFHFGEGMHKVRAARLEAERARLEQEDLVEAMSLELAQATNNLTEAYLETQTAERNLAAAAENLRSAQKAYAVGYEGLSDLLEAQMLWQQAAAQLADARCQQMLTTSRYLKATGRLSAGNY